MHPVLTTASARKRVTRLTLLPLLATLVTGCASGPSINPSQTTLVTPRVEVPMMFSQSGLPEVTATVNGQRVRCLVDTGAFACMVAPSLPPRANLVARPSPINVVDAGGNKHTTLLRAIPSCSIGKATFTSFDAVEADLKPVTPLLASRPGPAPAPVEMVVSPALFRDVLWTIDYATGRMAFEQGSLPAPDGREILPMQVAAGGHLLIPGSIAQQNVWLLMDTGFTGGLAVPDWAMSAFPGASEALASGEVQFYHGKGTFNVSRLSSDLSLGRHLVAKPLIMPRLGKEATIGTEYLKYFTITIDQRNQRVRLHRTASTPIQSATLAMHLDRASGVVTAIREGGAAQRAGVHVGDRVVSIDGVPFPDFAAGHHPRLPLRPGFITFQLLPTRGGPTVTAAIPYSEIDPTSPVPNAPRPF